MKLLLILLAIRVALHLIYEIGTRLAFSTIEKADPSKIVRTSNTPVFVNLEKGRTKWLPRFLDLIWLADNADEDYDASYLPNKPHWVRKIRYLLRNPFHNLFFFHIGVADRSFERFSLAPGNWGPGPDGAGLNVAFIQLPTMISGYPFVSYRKTIGGRNFQFYIGWRERGSFGIALRFKKVV